MRVYLTSATVLASLVAVSLFAIHTQAQGPGGPAGPSAGANAPRYGIAVVDISYIFKNYRNFTARMEQMKNEVQQAEASLRTEREAIAASEEKLKVLNPGTPDYKRLDEQITEQKAQFNLKATKQRKQFLEQEATIYFQAYQEVNDAVQYYAQRQKIGLVLRFNGDPIDPNNRQDVLRAINKPVVYQNSIDITPDIIRTLHRDGQQTGPIGGRPNPNVIPR